MKIFRHLMATVIACALGVPAMAEKLPLAAISTYFNDMTTAEAKFTQINDDGTRSTGQIYIRRPGRMRFEYDAPDDSLVLASGGQIAVFDSKSNQPPERFPLNKTPLKLILARNVDLNRAKMIVGHSENGPATSIVAQDPDHPDYGKIELVFTGDPVALRQWIVTDGSGQRTTVILGEFDQGNSYRNRLFNIRSEMSSRGFEIP